MSERISEIIDVLTKLKSLHLNYYDSDVSTLRIEATKLVAIERKIALQTVFDKFTRQLGINVDEFDKLVTIWLQGKPNQLKAILLNNSSDNNDENLIESFFYKNIIVLEKENKGLEDYSILQEFDETEFIEGYYHLVSHWKRERSKKLIDKAKKYWKLKYKNNIVCFVCSFSFREFYGQVGEGYIEAHHIVPISQISDDIVTKIEDLIPLCSNCHRIVHRNYKKNLTIEQLKEIVLENRI